jgi:preprotein translocase subunit SecA
LVQSGELADSPDILIPGFALVNEAARRTAGIRFYDVQLLVGLAMSRNTIAEMATGEGKTFVGALPSFIHSLHGRGVHLMTTNTYLAERDHEIVMPILQQLGVSTGILRAGATQKQKKEAYDCDVTYGPGYEFGFDYLRDQVALLQQPKAKLGETYRKLRQGQQIKPIQTIQRGHAFAIVDELDSVLIDEATTPLLLSSASADENAYPDLYRIALEVAAHLKLDEDYLLEAATNRLRLTNQGAARAYEEFERVAGLELRRPWPDYVEQGLHATQRMKRDVDYVIQDDKVKIVDQLTGRIFDDRSWRDGLHQLVEAKEGVTITPENEPLAKISRQQYFRLYDGLCGMTGTATGAEREFWHFYRLTVTVIPTRKPNRREVFPTRFFRDADAKWDAVAEQIQSIQALGQPVLVGTRTIDSSEVIAERLEQLGLKYRLLNGKQDAEEAAIIGQAGTRNAVTIATNMAGRGTDIKLGPGVEELGGLHVIVSEPHESVRAERQLMGRAARQGNRGSCQSFVSADDELIRRHACWLGQHMKRIAGGDGVIAEDLSPAVAKVRNQVERSNYARRRSLFARDTWLEDVMAKLAKST